MTKIKLFFIPYAGGSVSVYFKWKPHFHDFIEFVPLELSGRGKRMKEPFYKSIEDGVEDLYALVKPHVANGEPYMFFGHSMATIFVYELVCKLQKELLNTPVHIFLSGRTPPHLHKNYEPTQKMSDEEFLMKLKAYGGTSDVFFQSEELMKIFVPILRADYTIVENYDFEDRGLLMDTDLTFFFSDDDIHVSLAQAALWQDYIKGHFEILQFPGSHFYINHEYLKLIKIINQTAMRYILNKG